MSTDPGGGERRSSVKIPKKKRRQSIRKRLNGRGEGFRESFRREGFPGESFCPHSNKFLGGGEGNEGQKKGTGPTAGTCYTKLFLEKKKGCLQALAGKKEKIKDPRGEETRGSPS